MPIGFFLTDASELREKQLNKETVELGSTGYAQNCMRRIVMAVYGHTKVGHFFLHSEPLSQVSLEGILRPCHSLLTVILKVLFGVSSRLETTTVKFFARPWQHKGHKSLNHHIWLVVLIVN